MDFQLLGPALVTGGTGFIGRHLCRALLARGLEVHVFSRQPAHASAGSHVQWWQIDLRSASSVKDIISRIRPVTVFHFAGCTSGRGRADASALNNSLTVNLHGSLALFDALTECLPTLTRVVCAGGLEEYGNGPVPFIETQREQPVSAYSVAQVAATHVAQMFHRQHGLPCTILRFGLVYGPEQPPSFLIPALVESCLAGRPFPMTDGQQTRDYVYVEDAVDAALRAAGASSATGQIINVSEGVERHVADVARRVVEMTAASHVLQLGALPHRRGEVHRMLCDTSKARSLLNWTAATPFDSGLRSTVRWHSEHAGTSD